MSEVRLESVSVSYGDRRAVSALTEVVAPGEWLGLVGPNGAGKSSLIRAVAALVPSTGGIRVGGRALGEMSERERARRIAYVPQQPIVPDDMRVRDYVLLGRWPFVGRLGAHSRSDRDAVEAILVQLRLDDLSDRPLAEVSGGERQRAVIARALAQEPTVLLLDEPTSALDIGHQQQALELVTELRCRRQLTVIAAMHDLTLASTYADRLLMLDGGEAVARGAAADVLTAERLGAVFHACVTVEVDPGDGTVIVVPRRGFPVVPT
ncbi:ABC transporter ATP-binding protein [Ilumatobacter sp.]|uniref:ABC transporter ATP-binding protein n=1 Tax=Ilumatobacter sp. TaxID=1967498 RepID=UPI003B51DE86